MQQSVLQSSKLLIVDDEPLNIELLQSVLQRAGYRNIISTNDPRNTIHICEEQAPDLILLDMNMPHINGVEVLDQLRANTAYATLPVIILTANNSKNLRINALKAGAKDFITKPFDRTEVLTRIRNLLETKRLYDQLKEQNKDLDQVVQHRTQELREEQARLKELNNNLEDIVSNRTTDLMAANEELEQVNHTMSELVSVVSHELKTPLTSIKSFAEILRDEDQNLDHQSRNKFLNIIDKESDRLSRLISDLLDLQKISSGKMVWKTRLVDLALIIKDTIEFFDPAYQEKKISLEFNNFTQSCNVLTDPDKITQVMLNLLSNALKFTQQGKVSITLKEKTQWANILIVSPDKNAVEAMQSTCEAIDSKLYCVPNLQEAIQMIKVNGGSIDIAIIDISKAGTDNLVAVDEIRNRYPELPITILYESESSPLSTDKSIRYVAGSIKKPINQDQQEVIENLFSEMIGVSPKLSMLEISVNDTGLGIPEEELCSVFSRFHQVDSSQSREYSGTGLGLTICRQIVEHYYGKIWAESQMNSGSTFKFLLPEMKNDSSHSGISIISKESLSEQQLRETLNKQNQNMA